MTQADDYRAIAIDAINLLHALVPVTTTPPTQPPPTVDPAYPGPIFPAHDKATLLDAFAKLPSNLPGIVELPWGASIAGGDFMYGRSGGLSHEAPHVIRTKPGGPPAKLLGTLRLNRASGIHHLRVMDLDIAGYAVESYSPGTDFAFQRLRITGGKTAYIFQAPDGTKMSDIEVDGGLVADLDGKGASMVHAMYLHGVWDMTVRNWTADNLRKPANMFSHTVYSQPSCGPIHFEGCLFSRTSTDVMLRGGGSTKGCLFYFCPIGASYGGESPSAAAAPTGVDVVCNDNGFYGGGDISAAPGDARGTGLYIQNTRKGEALRNFFANGTGGQQRCIVIAPSVGSSVGVLNTTVSGNVRYKWGGGLIVESGPTTGSSFQSMPEWSGPGVDVNPDAFRPNFVSEVRAGKVTVAQYLAWARARFGMEPV